MIDDPEIYRTVLQRLSAGVYFVDRDRRIVFWNRGAEEITGHLSQQVLGHQMTENFLEHFGFENRKLEGDDLPLNAALRHGKELDLRASIRHKDGHPVRVHVRAVALRDEFGKLLGAAEFFEPAEPLFWQDERRNMLAIHGCVDRSTGALTREYIETQLNEHSETFRRHRVPFSILLIQVDRLDALKARHGSGGVTAVMRVAALTLLDALRSPDLLGRWSELQYLVVASECAETDAPRLADRLRKTVSGADADWWGDRLKFTISIGIATVKDHEEMPALIQRAESALQRASSSGDSFAVQFD